MKENKGSENLIPMNKRTKDEQRRIATMGGKASGEVRREKKMLKDLLEMFGEKPATERARKAMKAMGIRDEDLTNNMACVVGLFQKAIKGDVAAFNAIRDLRGEKPVERTEIDGRFSGGIEIGFVETGITPASSEEEVEE